MQLLNPLSSGGRACALRRVLSWPVVLPLLIALVLSAGPGARAQDPATAAVVLVMVEDPGCPYCARWTAEIEPGEIGQGHAIPRNAGRLSAATSSRTAS